MPTRTCQSILYVDDDPDICEVVLATLGSIAGLSVHTASSGEQAIDLAYELRPDLVLMDLMMPGIDGPSTLKRMRESAVIATIPVIFMTSRGLPQELAYFLELGAIGVIPKPFDPLTLYDELSVLWEQADIAHGITSERRGLSSARLQSQVASLSGSFLERTRADGIRLREMIERARQGERSVLKDIEHVAHSIHGSGAMFGFPPISVLGRVIERLVDGSTANTATPGLTGELTVLQQLSNHVERLVQEVEAAANAPPSSLGMFQGGNLR